MDGWVRPTDETDLGAGPGDKDKHNGRWGGQVGGQCEDVRPDGPICATGGGSTVEYRGPEHGYELPRVVEGLKLQTQVASTGADKENSNQSWPLSSTITRKKLIRFRLWCTKKICRCVPMP